MSESVQIRSQTQLLWLLHFRVTANYGTENMALTLYCLFQLTYIVATSKVMKIPDYIIASGCGMLRNNKETIMSLNF